MLKIADEPFLDKHKFSFWKKLETLKCMGIFAKFKTVQNKSPMGHDSLTWVKQPLHICRYHTTFFQYCHIFPIQKYVAANLTLP